MWGLDGKNATIYVDTLVDMVWIRWLERGDAIVRKTQKTALPGDREGGGERAEM